MTQKLTEIQLRDDLEKLETDKQRILLDLSKTQEELRIKDITNEKLSAENKHYIELKSKYDNDLHLCNQKIFFMEKETENLTKQKFDLNLQITILSNQINYFTKSSEQDKIKIISIFEYNKSLKNMIKKLQKQLQCEKIEFLNLQTKFNLATCEIENLKKINEKFMDENKCFKESILQFDKYSVKEKKCVSSLTNENAELKAVIKSYSEKNLILEKQLLTALEQNTTLEKHIQLISTKTCSVEQDLITNCCLLKQIEKKLSDVNEKYEVVNQERSLLELNVSELKDNEMKFHFSLNEIVANLIPIDAENLSKTSILEKIKIFKEHIEGTRTENIDLLYKNERLLITSERLANQLNHIKNTSLNEINKIKVNSNNNNCNVSLNNKFNKKLHDMQTRISNLEQALKSKNKAKSSFIADIRDELNQESIMKILYPKNFNLTDELTFKIIKELFTNLIVSHKEGLEQKKKLLEEIKLYKKKFETFAMERELFNKQMFKQ